MNRKLNNGETSYRLITIGIVWAVSMLSCLHLDNSIIVRVVEMLIHYWLKGETLRPLNNRDTRGMVHNSVRQEQLQLKEANEDQQQLIPLKELIVKERENRSIRKINSLINPFSLEHLQINNSLNL